MRKPIAWLCLMGLLCGLAASASAEPLIYTGASGFTLTLPEDWLALIGGDEEEEEDGFWEDLQPGEQEALFSSGDGAISLSVIYAADAPVEPSAYEALFGEAAMEARSAGLNGYQKMYYRYDAEGRRAFLSYSYVEPDEQEARVEYLVGFVTASEAAQFFTVVVRQDQHDAHFQIISEIVNSLDVGDLREGAEG